MRRNAATRKAIPLIISNGSAKTDTRFRWRWLASPQATSITAEQNVVTIEGRKNEEKREFLYHGISARAFRRQFSLADHVEVKNASFENGILRIDLVREVPEAMKPRKIEINAGSSPSNVHQIESKAA